MSPFRSAYSIRKYGVVGAITCSRCDVGLMFVICAAAVCTRVGSHTGRARTGRGDGGSHPNDLLVHAVQDEAAEVHHRWINLKQGVLSNFRKGAFVARHGRNQRVGVRDEPWLPSRGEGARPHGALHVHDRSRSGRNCCGEQAPGTAGRARATGQQTVTWAAEGL